MSQRLSLVTVGPRRQPFACTVCRGQLFSAREVKLNTTGAEFFNMGWANASADGLVCDGCGYLHTFVSGAVELWKPDGGYPGAELSLGQRTQPVSARRQPSPFPGRQN